MTTRRVDVKDGPIGTPYHFADAAAAVPAPIVGQPQMTTTPRAGTLTWLRSALRVVRNAAIAVALLTLVPVAIVAVRGRDIVRAQTWSENLRQRRVLAERLRFMAVPRDPSITPVEAGRALVSLTGPSENPSGLFHETEIRRHTAPWDSLKIMPGMFPGAQPTAYTTPSWLVIRAATSGFSAPERAYLQAIALSPIWHDVGIVARAPAIDITGARLRVPFPAGATWEEMPLIRTRQLREIGNASYSRAAWFLANGQRDSAEATLRTMISLGFALIDNATTMQDEFAGSWIIGFGREGLRTFYEAVGDPAASSKAVAPLQTKDYATEAYRSADELRTALIARVKDPSAPRGERIETVRALAFTSCSNVTELLLGPSKDVLAAVETARRTLPRYPSERAMLDLAAPMPQIHRQNVDAVGLPLKLAVSASAVAGIVLHNDRLATCALVAGQMP